MQLRKLKVRELALAILVDRTLALSIDSRLSQSELDSAEKIPRNTPCTPAGNIRVNKLCWPEARNEPGLDAMGLASGGPEGLPGQGLQQFLWGP